MCNCTKSNSRLFQLLSSGFLQLLSLPLLKTVFQIAHDWRCPNGLFWSHFRNEVSPVSVCLPPAGFLSPWVLSLLFLYGSLGFFFFPVSIVAHNFFFSFPCVWKNYFDQNKSICSICSELCFQVFLQLRDRKVWEIMFHAQRQTQSKRINEKNMTMSVSITVNHRAFLAYWHSRLHNKHT